MCAPQIQCGRSHRRPSIQLHKFGENRSDHRLGPDDHFLHEQQPIQGPRSHGRTFRGYHTHGGGHPRSVGPQRTRRFLRKRRHFAARLRQRQHHTCVQ